MVPAWQMIKAKLLKHFNNGGGGGGDLKHPKYSPVQWFNKLRYIFKMEYLQWLKRRNFLCTDMKRPLRFTVRLKKQIVEHYVYSVILFLWEENFLRI